MMAFAVGLVTGTLSACGLGGGTLLLLYLSQVLAMDFQIAQGINLLFFLPAGFMAIPAHQKGGFLDKKVIIPAVISGLCTAVLGVFVGNAIETALVRKIFGGFLLILGLWTLFFQAKSQGKEENPPL